MSHTITGRPYVSVDAAPRMARKIRRPEHRSYVHFLPHVLQPFMFAPVLPGETLKNILFQARVITTPVVNPVVGWWLETYWFYVKHRHFPTATRRDAALAMMLDLNASTANLAAGAPLAEFNLTTGDGMWAREAYFAVVREFFRGDGETETTARVGATELNYVRCKLPGWWDSIIPETNLTTGLGGVADDLVGTGNTLDTVSEVARAIETYNHLRMLGVTNMEYDDWLRSFGVSIAAPKEDRPELLRYTREWQYPSNAVSVDSTAQRVSSVLSWSITERADKDRYFKEPGILVGCVVARPKLYHGRAQAGVGLLMDALSWMAPFARSSFDTYKPLIGTAGQVVDVKDLFLHGDQYRYVHRGTSVPTMTFPADGVFDYPDTTVLDGMFVDGVSGFVRMDAVTSLQIASRIGSDTTPSTT